MMMNEMNEKKQIDLNKQTPSPSVDSNQQQDNNTIHDDDNDNDNEMMAEIVQTLNTKVKIIYRKHHLNDELPEVELTNIIERKQSSKLNDEKEIEFVRKMIEENVKLNNEQQQQQFINQNNNDSDEETCDKQLKSIYYNKCVK